MIDYEANIEKFNKENEQFMTIINEVQDSLFDLLLSYSKGDIDLDTARRKVLRKALFLEFSMGDYITNDEVRRIRYSSLGSYNRTDHTIKEFEKESEEDMKKNTEHIDIPSSSPNDFVESASRAYQNIIEQLLLEMSELIKEGHEIQWSENDRWCKINGKVFNIHKKVWESRKHEVL